MLDDGARSGAVGRSGSLQASNGYFLGSKRWNNSASSWNWSVPLRVLLAGGRLRMRGGHLTLPAYNASRPRDGTQDVKDALVGCALHQHKLHLSEVYGLRRNQAGRIFLKNDGLVFHEGE